MTVERRPRRGPSPGPDRAGRSRRDAALQRLRAALRTNLAPRDGESLLLPLLPDSADSDEPVPTPPAGEEELPENTIYRDDGCHVAPACLSCPLPTCIYDRKTLPKKTARRQRDIRIRTLAGRGWTTDRIAHVFHLSPAQVRRIRGRKQGRRSQGGGSTK